MNGGGGRCKVRKVYCDIGGHWFYAHWSDPPLRFFNTENKLGVTCPHCYLLAALAGTTLEQREKRRPVPIIERAPENVLDPLSPDHLELSSIVGMLAAVLHRQGHTLTGLETSSDTGIVAINTQAGKVTLYYQGMLPCEAWRRTYPPSDPEPQP
jgi:hypothetical protein